MSDRLTDDVLGALWAASLEDAALGQVRPKTLGFLIDELRARRQADESLAMVTQLAREILAERPPLPGKPNTVHARLTDAVALLDKLLAHGGGR